MISNRAEGAKSNNVKLFTLRKLLLRVKLIVYKLFRMRLKLSKIFSVCDYEALIINWLDNDAKYQLKPV